MPTSHWSYISKTVDLIKGYNPKSILEVGVGFGKYGFLAREFLEVYGANHWQKKDWKVIIDGVEIYTPYITEQIEHYYDNIFNKNIVDLLKTQYNGLRSHYDLSLMMDVIEHLPKEQGLYVIRELCKMAKISIFAIPLGDWRYEVTEGNTAESHVSVWDKPDLLCLNGLVEHNYYPVSGKEIGLFVFENK